jgi:hypothetical protein
VRARSLYLSRMGRKIGLAAPFVAMVCLAGAGVAAQTFRTGVDVVNVSLAIMDKAGTAVDGLQVTDFELYENGKKQEIRYFARGDAPAAAWARTSGWRAARPSSSSTACSMPRT